jgi:hypothetical protein
MPPPKRETPAPPPPVQPVATSWDFRTGEDACVAIAAAANVSLEVTVHRGEPIHLVTTVPSAPPGRQGSVTLRFAGGSGSWQLSARMTGPRQATALLGDDETDLSQLLLLLGGGVLEVGGAGKAIASLALREAGPHGRDWFDCARHNIL